jgi:hypothetical protein
VTIDRPIILIGTGRCGSTILYEALALHEDLAWFSNYDNRFPRLPLTAMVPRLLALPLLRRLPRGEKPQWKQGRHRLNRYLPRPGEVYRKWEVLCGEKFSFDFLLGVEANERERRAVRRAFWWRTLCQGKPRFICKLTGPPRIGYLTSIFPDALFVDVVRDARAVVHSLLRVPFWQESGGGREPHWRGGLPEGWQDVWRRFGETEASLAALQVRAIHEASARERASLPPDRYIEVRYEDFVVDSRAVLERVLSFAGLGSSPQLTAWLDGQDRYASMDEKWKTGLSPQDITAVESIMAPGSPWLPA